MTKLKSKSNSKLKRLSALALLLTMLFSTLTGCDNRQEASQLAKTGAIGADTLAKYYDSLIQDTYDIWDMSAFLVQAGLKQGDVPIPLSDKAVGELQKTVEELNKRVRLAKNLSSTYGALQELSSYDASGEVKKSTESLADSIKGLGVIPGATAVPSKVFGMIAEDITKWKQSKDIRKGSALILQTVEKLHVLFQQESKAYKSISTEKAKISKRAINYLINKEQVTSLPLLQKIPEPLGLKLLEVDKAVKDPQTKKALIEVVSARENRLAQMLSASADSIESSLLRLASNHRLLQNKTGLSLGDVISGFERAKAYIDEVNKSRNGNEK